MIADELSISLELFSVGLNSSMIFDNVMFSEQENNLFDIIICCCFKVKRGQKKKFFLHARAHRLIQFIHTVAFVINCFCQQFYFDNL